MTLQGTITKMLTENGSPIQYYLNFESDFLHINTFLNKNIEIQHVGYQCLTCLKPKKIFRQGCCYDCFMSSASVGDWIMKPELSTAHLDIEDRDLTYEKKVQLQPHIVYLALSGNVKVGVTRKTQVPTRWIDQGATKAIPIVEVPNRYLAGITEVALKNHFADKTNWKSMLENNLTATNLVNIQQSTFDWLPAEAKPYFLEKPTEITFEYPMLNYIKIIKSLNLETAKTISGKLIGIKGQYLIFDNGTALNVRTYEGFMVKISL